MKILILHDLDRPFNEELVEELEQVYEVISPELTREQILDADYLESLIKSLLGEAFMIVGEGLGAAWAYHFSEKYDCLSLLINPCLEVKTKYNLDIDSLDEYLFRSIVLFDKEKFIDLPGKLEGCKNVYLYNSEKNNLLALVKKYLVELDFNYRTRSWSYGDFRDYEHLGSRAAGWVIGDILFAENPMAHIPIKTDRRSIYDLIGQRAGYDLIILERDLEFSLDRWLRFYFDAEPDSEAIKKIAKKSLASFPAVVERLEIPFTKSERDLSSNLTPEQVVKLKEVNDKLTEFQSRVFPQVIEIDSEYHQRLSDSADHLNKYSLFLDVQFYLQEDDPEHRDDDDNFMAIICELETGCSQNSDSFLYAQDQDYNDLPKEHPLSSFKHCWLFHHLYAVSNVCIKDLLRIGMVWIDIDVSYQQKLAV